MLFKVQSGLEEYVEPTDLCDCRSPVITSRSSELIGQATTPKDAAIKVFYFVRDEIAFEVKRADERASETLQRGSGFCVTKANLQIALLRAIGIPARYHHVHLSKDILRGLFPEPIYDRLADVITYHPWCECYLTDHWVPCEALFPEGLFLELCERGFMTSDKIPTIDWDGETGLVLCAPWIVKDEGVTHSMDSVFRETQIAFSAAHS